MIPECFVCSITVGCLLCCHGSLSLFLVMNWRSTKHVERWDCRMGRVTMVCVRVMGGGPLQGYTREKR